MLSLIKKELLQFFGSPIAYVILVVFALITGLFLWFFDGNMNILSGGYASLSSFFDLAPWLYLFLVPAITMRLFSEEAKSGTLELLLTRPVSLYQLIAAKLIASFSVVFLTLILSLVYFISVYQLGYPVGVVDVAATLGSYLGLFFLLLVFLSVGLFASSVSDNQIVAFVIAVLLSFFLFSGFELLSDLFLSSVWSSFFLSPGISVHYESVSRGMLDNRDLFYFVTVSLLFLTLTRMALKYGRIPFVIKPGKALIYAGIFFCLILFTQIRLFRLDFTSEKRYTLSPASIRVLEKMDENMLAEIYLAGDMPPGFRRLKTAIEEKLADLQQYGKSSIVIRTIDPYKEVPAKELKAYFNSLYRQGIVPTDLRIKTEQGISSRLVFPTVVFRYREKSMVLNLLKNDPMQPAEENLNRSIEMLEFEFMNAIHILMQEKPIEVAFLEGHGEADSLHVYDFSTTLKANYVVSRLNCDQLLVRSDTLKVVIIANPQDKFPEKDKLILDQFLMKGGKLIWLLDPVRASMDSLSEGMTTLALPVDLNLGDLLYRYGIRLNSDLIQDAECMQIRVDTSLPGSPAKYSLAPWYFSPLLHPIPSNPAGRQVNPVAAEFLSSMDTVGENFEIKKRVLLRSSPLSRKNEAPLLVNLRMIDTKPSAGYFTHQNLIGGILLEGKFGSVYRNRLIDRSVMPSDWQLMPESKPTSMAVFSDGGLLSNKANKIGNESKIVPLGYDRVSKITFGNRDFFYNLVQYMCDDASLSALRGKAWKLRLLDKVKTNESGNIVKWLNLLLPLAGIALLGGWFTWWRKRRNGRETKRPMLR